LKVTDKINPAVRHDHSTATRPLKRQIGIEDVDSIEVELGIDDGRGDSTDFQKLAEQ
jgi:hypothetical protein